MHRTYPSTGVLRYQVEDDRHKIWVTVDPQIVNAARALVPKAIRLNRQRYPPHITVVRFETPVKNWGRREGEEIPFTYSPIVYNDECYYWLRAWSDELLALRQDLGLPPLGYGCRPPDEENCFHLTIGNTKG